MATLIILFEDSMDKAVLRTFLRPFWSKRFTDAEVVPYHGNTKLINRLRVDTAFYLRPDPDQYVLCLVDLYQNPYGLKKNLSVEERYN